MEKKRPYLPTLFDRLLDDEPKQLHEAYDVCFYDARTMRRLVQRDIAAILNNTNIEDRLEEKRDAPALESVVNYGVAAMTGKFGSSDNWALMEKRIRSALLRFEPRLIPESLLVRLLTGKDEPSRGGLILFEIRALIYWDPNPIDLCVNGVYDRETEHIALSAS
ncbi:type VI secretion system baseplate subunit TssE [Atlantibacter hermannii]|uniref:type VI secretion system baseplate subunit TssE n=1 Tax=Atlantibacter hermannii TaxID=565 RepID=UPI001932AC4B|nr:GPW/gp25 family protein [Atlantibacter hermannii]MBL7635704.1 GPW/gp25 family protein [Atlantibacter hermannii]MBL7674985.1 GPW/gp25 family protein [Atlantibacter hermannii]